jgi:hypothetical protein
MMLGKIGEPTAGVTRKRAAVGDLNRVAMPGKLRDL